MNSASLMHSDTLLSRHAAADYSDEQAVGGFQKRIEHTNHPWKIGDTGQENEQVRWLNFLLVCPKGIRPISLSVMFSLNSCSLEGKSSRYRRPHICLLRFSITSRASTHYSEPETGKDTGILQAECRGACYLRITHAVTLTVCRCARAALHY